MPLPHDTTIALGVERNGVNFRHCHSRSLMLDRLANPALDKDDRRDFFLNAFKKTPVRDRLPAWQSFLSSEVGLSAEAIFFAQLQSRLMVNMAGGVMENAGLCLDRFGVPYIPGSAVKGCARRMAIQNLLEAREAKEPADALGRLLADIALVFGWSELEWRSKGDLKPHRNETDEQFQKRWEQERSDFAYACGDTLWPLLREEVRKRLREELQCKEFPTHFAGSVSFLPAYPHQLPANDLELDIVTCHHPDYYSQKKDRAGSLVMPVALDTEEPNPVVFPAVSPGKGTEQDRSVFAFVTLPLRTVHGSATRAGAQLHQLAREWLRASLATFGLGAKTAAGYGWFDASEAFNQRYLAEQKEKAEAEAKRLEAEQAVSEAKAKERADEEEKERRRGGLTPDDSWVAQFNAFPEAKRREVINKFAFEEEKWWPTQGELTDERIQFSLLHFLVNIEPDFLAADRANPKSKTAKALAGLKRKFPAMAPSS